MAHERITDEELAELVQRTEIATSAFLRGDMERYLALTPHARGFTLMAARRSWSSRRRTPGATRSCS